MDKEYYFREFIDKNPKNWFKIKAFKDRYSTKNFLVTESSVEKEKAKNYY